MREIIEALAYELKAICKKFQPLHRITSTQDGVLIFTLKDYTTAKFTDTIVTVQTWTKISNNTGYSYKNYAIFDINDPNSIPKIIGHITENCLHHPMNDDLLKIIQTEIKECLDSDTTINTQGDNHYLLIETPTKTQIVLYIENQTARLFTIAKDDQNIAGFKATIANSTLRKFIDENPGKWGMTKSDNFNLADPDSIASIINYIRFQ